MIRFITARTLAHHRFNIMNICMISYIKDSNACSINRMGFYLLTVVIIQLYSYTFLKKSSHIATYRYGFYHIAGIVLHLICHPFTIILPTKCFRLAHLPKFYPSKIFPTYSTQDVFQIKILLQVFEILLYLDFSYTS